MSIPIMRVLSLWQPWASLCVTWDPLHQKMAKEFETRHWRPDTRAGIQRIDLPIKVLIHATQKDQTRQICSGGDWNLAMVINRLFPLAMPRFPRGMIVGVAEITAIHKTEDMGPLLHGDEVFAGNYEPGRFAWQLDRVERLKEPIHLTGRQEPLWRADSSMWDRIADAELVDPRP